MVMTARDDDIRHLLARYDRAIDFGDADAFVACFPPDGFVEVSGLPSDAAHAGRRYAGHPALRTFVRELYAGLHGHVRHCTTLPIIEGDGETATLFSYLFEVRVGVLPRVGVPMTGVSEESLAKVAGRWRFTSRRCRVDPQPEQRALVPSDLLVTRFDPAHAPARPVPPRRTQEAKR